MSSIPKALAGCSEAVSNAYSKEQSAKSFNCWLVGYIHFNQVPIEYGERQK